MLPVAWRLLYRTDPERSQPMPASPYDEMTAPDGTVRPHYRAVADWLTRTPPARVAT